MKKKDGMKKDDMCGPDGKPMKKMSMVAKKKSKKASKKVK